MKTPALLLGLCLLPAALFAVAPYPSQLTVKYKDKMLPVVRVKKTDPVVVVDGKEKVLGSEVNFLMQAAPSFADNFVDAPKGALAGPFRTRFLGDSGASGPRSYMTYIEVPLTARTTIKRGFAAVIIYADLRKTKELQEKAFGLTEESAVLAASFLAGTSIILHDIPELPAGKTVKVKFSAGGQVALFSTDYFIQVFDDEGREVQTPDVAHAWEFYAMRERMRLFSAMGKYLERFKGTDRDAYPFATPKPIYPPEAVLPTERVVVTLTVEANGTVSAVDASQVTDTVVQQCIVDAMGGWLFLPSLKGGAPVATKVSVPLKF